MYCMKNSLTIFEVDFKQKTHRRHCVQDRILPYSFQSSEYSTNTDKINHTWQF